LVGKRLPFVIGALFFISGFTSFYAYISLLEGSPVILLGLFYLGILLSLRAGLDELAGALFLLSGFYLEVGAPFLLLVALWVFWERRWRVFSGTAMLGVILFTLAFFLYPGWLMPFLRAAWNSFRIGFGFTTREIFHQLWPGFGNTLSWVLTAILIVSLGYEWSGTRGANFRRFLWTAFLTLAATPLLGLPIQMDQLVVLTMPLILVIVISRERWRKWGNVIALALLILFFGLPWFLFVQGVPQGNSLSLDEWLFLFWPASAVIGLYWIRWWMIRPPRTWFDTATQLER
jgi:hypothetical protein